MHPFCTENTSEDLCGDLSIRGRELDKAVSHAQLGLECKKKQRKKENYFVSHMRWKERKVLLFFSFFIPVRRRKSNRSKERFSLSLPLHRLSFSDITCSHLIASSDRLVWIRVITVHITLSTSETYPVVGIKINSTRGKMLTEDSDSDSILWSRITMAQLATSSEINDEDDCQLVSFTNKLPYYVRHLCKSTNKNKTAVVTSTSSEYLRTAKLWHGICWFKVSRRKGLSLKLVNSQLLLS